jgi:hypothetical protein
MWGGEVINPHLRGFFFYPHLRERDVGANDILAEARAAHKVKNFLSFHVLSRTWFRV